MYDPLARVGFFNPKIPNGAAAAGGEGGRGDEYEVTFPSYEKLPALYIPSMCFQRTLYCYVKDEEVMEDDGMREKLLEGINKWQENHAFMEQIGTSNLPTPNPNSQSGATPSSKLVPRSANKARLQNINNRLQEQLSNSQPLATIGEL